MTEAKKQGEVLIEVKGLRKHFGHVEVLKDINMQIHRGEVVVVIGPSGSGKSTFLRCLNLLETPTGGEIWFDGKQVNGPDRMNINKYRERIGMVFQLFNLFENLSVLDNVTIGPRKVKGIARAQAEEEAMALLTRMGLADKAKNHPSQLSGGQKQRVAIARTLAMKPEAILFDEATSALDPEMVGEVLQVMRQLALDGNTMVVVTHEIGFAREVGDRMVLIDGGVVVEEGEPKAFIADPQHQRSRDFLSKIL